MPSLQCPECRKELLPQDLIAGEESMTCGKCGREIYLKKRPAVNLKCPKCGGVAASSEFCVVEED
jgi:predicted RNA-binding Zn-ribbon protein involved in translation (DUF1610 family)